MKIVTKTTRVQGEVNEKLFARSLAIKHLQSSGVKFTSSPTGSELCVQLGISEQPIHKKQASSLLLIWAYNKQHQ